MASEATGHTLQPTALVHEAWLRLGRDQQPAWANRAHFFAAAAECMRYILIDHARRKGALRRAGTSHLHKDPDTIPDFPFPFPQRNDAELLLIHEALDALQTIDPRKAELVKQRYFIGLSLDEAADLLGISRRTAQRDWIYARSWLHTEMKRLRR